jgi:hypothetical protein
MEGALDNREPTDRPEGKDSLDLGRLMGFSAVAKSKVDFRDPTFAARVGAKVGDEDSKIVD